MESLSVRGRRALSPALSYFDKQLAGVAAGLYDAQNNKDGYILMAVAENRLPRSYSFLEKKLQMCRTIEPSSTAYTNMCGRQILREAFAKTIMRTVLHQSVLPSNSSYRPSTVDIGTNGGLPSAFSSSSSSNTTTLTPSSEMDTTDTTTTAIPPPPTIQLNPDHFVVSSGVGAVINNLAFTLLDTNDGVLLPTPTYGALYNDFSVLAQTRIIDVPLDNDKYNYRITWDALEEAYVTATQVNNITVKMLFLINPNNPLGIVYTEKEIEICITFCQKYKLHLVCDEIYANSVYEPSTETPFKSIVQIMAEKSTTRTSSVSSSTSTASSSTHVPLKNTSPDFVGYKTLKQYLQKQVREFEQCASNSDWSEIHHSHYDWWTFPIPDKSSYGFKFSVFEGDILELQKDPEYLRLLDRAAELVCLAWGWNLRESKPIPVAEREDGQAWSRWPVRLFKLALALDLFGRDELCASARLFGQILIKEGERFSYGGHDLAWQFTAPYERPPRNDNVPYLYIPKRSPTGTPSAPSDNFLGDYIHVLWGFSKDFAMSGFRVGCLYTHNQALLSAMGNINYFTSVSNDMQDTLARMLNDQGWIDDFFLINKEELRKSSIAVRKLLDKANIPYVYPSAGMFIWIDLREYLPKMNSSSSSSSSSSSNRTDEGTNDFLTEKQLVEELYKETRLLFTPGEACHAREPGFFRCCFAWMPLDAVVVGFERLERWVHGKQTKGNE